MVYMIDPLYLVGIDEAGRGPLAGPVAVGAVMIPQANYAETLTLFYDVRDSKKLSEKKRELMYKRMAMARTENKLFFTVCLVPHTMIDAFGIVAAVKKGIASVLEKLQARPEQCRILLDGSIFAPPEFNNQTTIVRGDETEPIISLASVAAKVVRDRKMKQLALLYPQYGFEVHKGYGTRAHYEAITRNGICAIHRHSFL